MRPLLASLATCLSLTSAYLVTADWDNQDFYAVHIAPGRSIEDVAQRLGLSVHSPLGELEDHYLVEGPKQDVDVVDVAKRRRKRSIGGEDAVDHILYASKQSRRQRLYKRSTPERVGPMERQDSATTEETQEQIAQGLQIAESLDIVDPIYKDQWHLFNPIQYGHDINVTGVWLSGVTGKNSTVCIIDDGLDFQNTDLTPNYFAEGSWDFNNPGPDPLPRLSDDNHGTRCSGEIAAAKNDVCGVGVAYDGRVAGVRILSGPISDADEALALNYKFQQNQIYSCSWGPPDDGQSMDAPNTLVKRAILNGIQKGRNSLGSLFVFAIGNGAGQDDNCNFDGYANSIYSVSVGAIDRKGMHPYYSEACSAQLVVTYSSGSGDAIHTTDRGAGHCSVTHGGTSAAGPLVAGIYALVLEVRPDLTWRDVQYITLMTAIPVNEDNGDYQDTAIGRRFSHQYGYGKIDAYRIVEYAKTWQNVKPQAWCYSPWQHVRHEIPQGPRGLTSTLVVTQEMLTAANLERVEHVTVTMNVEHSRRGDVSVDLVSPSGVRSHLATARRHDKSRSGYKDWTFMSLAHWGETGIGRWTVIIKDTKVDDYNGTFVDWRLRLWGESIDGASQELLPMPTDHDDDDHDSDIATAIVGTTTHGEAAPTGLPEANPSDHITRPVNAKPTDAPTSTSVALPTETSLPEEEADDSDSDSDADDKVLPDPHFLPTPFPTFGVSKKTQIWIYGALALIAVFCVSLGAWYVMARRKAKKNARDEYEFEMLNEDDADDDGAQGLMNGNGQAKRKRRAGELYDAFAEGSEDDDVFSVGDEDEDEDDQGQYRDEAAREKSEN